jgi:hypothetical protein
MDSDHLANFHGSFSCFDKPAVSIERYQTEKADLLLEHLRERYGLDFERFPIIGAASPERRQSGGAASVGVS